MTSRTRRTRVSGWMLPACTLMACTAALAAPLAAHAAGTVAYVALGDSYTSGPLTGIPTSLLCFRSSNNYPQLVATAIQPASFTDVSCAGALTDNMTEPQTDSSGTGTNPPQFDALTPNTSLVTIGIGANDVGLIDIIDECFQLDLLSATGAACSDYYTAGGIDQISEFISQTAPKLAAVYQGIHARSPSARVLAVGYPAILPVNGTGCWPLTPLSPDDVSFLAGAVVAINEMIATVAAANDVQYVDTYTPTIGYDVCQAPGHAGFTALLPTSGLSFPLHPNALGEQLMAGAVINAIENPPTVPAPVPGKPTNPDLRLTSVALSRDAVAVSGTIIRSYRGRVTVMFASHYRRHRVHLRASTRVAQGRWHTRLHIPRRYRGKLRTATLTATSHREHGLTADTVHASARRG